MRKNLRCLGVLLASALVPAGVASAATYLENEAVANSNDSKATATALTVTNGDFIFGEGQNGTQDYYDLRFTNPTNAIYMTRVYSRSGAYNTGTGVFTATSAAPVHAGSFRTLVQNTNFDPGPGTVVPGSDQLYQLAGASNGSFNPAGTGASTNNRYIQLYTVGTGGRAYLRYGANSTGITTTNDDYRLVVAQTLVTPTNVGTFDDGIISLGNTSIAGGQNLVVQVYDSSFNAITGPGGNYLNDDADVLGRANLVRSFSNGTYYFAVSDSETTNNLTTPADDLFTSRGVADFSNVLVNRSSGNISTTSDWNFVVSDGTTNSTFNIFQNDPTGESSRYNAFWGTFTVVPEPTTLGLLGAAGIVALRRRTR